MNGTFALVLHSHIPFCRKSGVWPAGEEWLFEAMHETYIPLLEMMDRWHEDGVEAHLTMGVVPVLAEQLADPYMQQRFREYMEDRIRRAQRDVERFAGDTAMQRVAEYWREHYRHGLDLFTHRFAQDVPGTLRRLQDQGVCEIITSAASHGLLPLLEQDSAVRAQVRVGVQTYRKHFGRPPRGFWMPECAYRPAEPSRSNGRLRPGVDAFLVAEGIRYTLVENVGLTRANFVKDRYGARQPSPFQGYRLLSGLAVFGRNDATGKQVWSARGGYPGDACYLEFHRKDSQSGLRYWRVTGDDHKQVYDPAAALHQVDSHARHFVELLKAQAHRGRAEGVDQPLLVSPYDTELFGHWWHEGVRWLDRVFRVLAQDDGVETAMLGDITDARLHAMSTVSMGRSTWGVNGDETVWTHPQHAWVWPLINRSSEEMEQVVDALQRHGQPNTPRGMRILQQLAREQLLMQASDWPFLLFTGQASDYANQRFHHHHQRFNKLLWAARDLEDLHRLGESELAAMEDVDAVWPEMDPAVFRSAG